MEMLINGGASSNGAAREAAAFRDAEGAAQWLAGQPQANPSAMMSSLTGQLESFSRLNVSPRQRFKVLEILRKAVFAATAASQTRSAGKPLPLAADEQRALDAVRHLWRAFATAYQRCLQACLDGDSSLDGHAARVAHRVAACLHMEQVAGYASGAAPLAGFWHCLHTAFLTAEKLECGDEPVADRWPGDVSGTTFNGQYAMSLMLYLAQPFSMSGVQRTSVERWLARWRELAGVTAQAPADAESVSWRIDLGQDRPLCEDGESGEINLSRWLRLDAVLGKIRGRRAALQAGESPENLKLGSHLTADACLVLLATLGRHLRQVPPDFSIGRAEMPELSIAVGLASIHRLLGGAGINVASNSSPSMDDHMASEQLAVFGRVLPERRSPPTVDLERWRLAQRNGRHALLLRQSGNGNSRLNVQAVLAIRRQDNFLLAMATGVGQPEDGVLCCFVRLLSDKVMPRGVEIRDRITGKVERHPTLLLPSDGEHATRDLLLIPAGVMARASSVQFLDAGGQPLPGLRLGECLEHGNEVDVWPVVHVD